jgi:hypothetical protein
MKHHKSRALVGLFVGLTVAAMASCGSRVKTRHSSSDGGGDGVGGASSSSSSVDVGAGVGGGGVGGSGVGGSVDPSLARPPLPGPASAPDGVGSATFAFSKMYLGDTDRDGTVNKASGWKQFGFDIDARASTATSTDLCKPRQGAPPKNVYEDGDAGIDNSFGKNILPIFLAVASGFSAAVNSSIEKGNETHLVDLKALGAKGDYNPLGAQVFGGANRGGPPSFDGSDFWPIDPATAIVNGQTITAKLGIAQSYLVGNTWVGRGAGVLRLRLGFDGYPLYLPIRNPVIAMELDAAHTKATLGTISGVMEVEEMKAAVASFFGSADPALCPPSPTLDSILTQFEQAADILADGSQDPLKECDAVSIGLGFDATQVLLDGLGEPFTDPSGCAPP